MNNTVTLSHLMPELDWQHLSDIAFATLCLDTRQLKHGDAFALLKSAVNHDDANSAGYAIQAASTAALIFSEVDLTPFTSDITVPWLYLPHIRDILGELQQRCLQAQEPTSLPDVIAVTGTNGKTTVSQVIAQLIALTADKSVGVLGTTGNGIWPELQPASHTTGDVLSVHHQFHQLGMQGAQVLCLEASSHGLHQQRLQGLPISTAIYTNLSRDHLDYHSDMDDYAAAKARLFAWDGLEYAIINTDDAYADTMIAASKKTDATVWQYSLENDQADFYVNTYHAHAQGIRISLKTPTGAVELDSPLLGIFNIANLVAAVAAVFAQGVSLEAIAQAVAKLHGADGRMQAQAAFGANFIVDYAHTPDALENALQSLRVHAPQSSLTAVFGCGGDRDAGKRPLMTQAAVKHADKVIVTADNPRSESVDGIINDMLAGLSETELANITVESDRRSAIALAVNTAESGDVILIAGKGHETYQEIGGVRHDFDDRDILAEAITKRQL